MTPTAEPEPPAPMAEGETIVLVDSKQRRYLVALEAGGEFHSHAGILDHDQMIGRPEGLELRSNKGARFLALRPTLVDYVLKMPRGAQVIYPKDLGPILMMADIHPGLTVLESGVGSGALSTTLVRAGASVVGYELRQEFAETATANVVGFLGREALARYRVETRDAYQGIEERNLDRILLDLPEPWQVVPHVPAAMKPGGILLAYNPSISQVMALREALDAGPFGMIETVEVLNRSWHVDGYAVRPDHRMVAHTGFITHCRLLR